MNMRTSEQINEISAALAKAQGEISNPAKEAQNPHFRSHYADLSSGINAVRASLSSNGISFIQATRLEGDVLIVDTRLSHASGQWIESEFPACRFPAKPQEVGSALTYARRYALFALVGIAGEDDDGNAANATETPAQRKSAPTPPKPPSDTFDMENSQLTRDLLLSTMEMAATVADLQKWQVDNNATIARLLEADKHVVREAFGDLRQALRGKEMAA
jgi:hypothetical protein